MGDSTNNPDNVDRPAEDSAPLEELPQPADDGFGSRSPGSSMTEADVQNRRESGVEELPSDTEDELAEEDNWVGAQESLEKVAREVLDGKWGKGQERRMKLQDAGHDPNEVEAAVTKLLNPDA